MPVITQQELRSHLADVLRRAKAGERFTIMVDGHPAAQLGPPEERQWVGGPDLATIWDTPAPQTLADDLEHMPNARAAGKVTELLDGVPDAHDRAHLGLRQAAAGQTIPLDEL